MEMNLPLERFTVLDLTIARAGPTAVRQLADWGANVISIDPPGGDNSVGQVSQRHGSDFQNLHRNKRSLTLDLKTEKGKAVFYELVREADVVVENFRAPVKHRLGVDYETLKQINPRIIYGSIAGFGQDGPYSDRGGVDQIAQGLGGLMSVTGLPGQGPVRVGVPIADLTAGMYLSIGILVALLEREVSGEGQWVHTSLLEAQVAMLDFQATRWTIDGEVPPQAGNHHPTSIPMGVFPTADGHINIAAPGGKMWVTLCEKIGAQELLDDERFRNGKGRSTHRDELNERIGEYTKKRPSAEWIEILNEAGLPCGPINTIDATMADPQVKHLGLAVEVDHSVLGRQEIIRNAVNLTRTPHRMRYAAPELGEHVAEILAEAGYSNADIEALHAEAVV